MSRTCWVCGSTGPLHERIGGERCVDAKPCEARQPAYLAACHAELKAKDAKPDE